MLAMRISKAGLGACFMMGISVLGFSPSLLASGGGFSGGGGNTLAGRPLEAYAFDVTSTPEFLKIVRPTLDRIHRLLPKFSDELASIATQRIWYRVPVALNSLPEGQIGVGFFTEQTALQSFREVWLDDRTYSPMMEEDKALLIMHELLMGVRIYSLNQTLMGCYELNDPEYCSALLEIHAPKALDHAQVRSVSGILMRNLGSYDRTRLQRALIANGFTVRDPL